MLRLITSIQSEIGQIIELKVQTILSSLEKLNTQIKTKLNLSDDWDQIKIHFEKVHPDFFTRIKEDYPDLTVNDLKLCAYSKLKFSNKEIGRLLNINASSVQVSRYRLKKKMNISEETNFEDFIHDLHC
jgi:DNA-binding CsgD family transcriptional regulator